MQPSLSPEGFARYCHTLILSPEPGSGHCGAGNGLEFRLAASIAALMAPKARLYCGGNSEPLEVRRQ